MRVCSGTGTARVGFALWWSAALLFGLVWCGSAHGQGAGAEQSGHAWVVLTRDPARSALLHLPARRLGEDRPTVRIARWFAAAPERIGWHGSNVWFVFSPEVGGPTGLQRQVLKMEVVRGFAGGWDYEPSERPTTLPSLPGRSELLGFVGSEMGPVAMLREQGGSAAGDKNVATTPRMMVLDADGWKELDVPWGKAVTGGAIAGGGTFFHLVSTRDGIGVLAVGGPGVEWWTRSMHRRMRRGEMVDTAWVKHEIPLGRSTVQEAALRTSSVYWVDGQLLGLENKDGGLVVTGIRTSGLYELGEVSDIGADYRIAPILGSNILSVLWKSEPSGNSASGARYQFADISASSGRVLSRGVATMPGPVSRNEIRFLTAALVGIMVAVLLIVLRPSPEEEEQAETDTGLPREFVPARIVRRVAATVVDVGLALIVASVVLGWVSGLDAGTAGSEYGWILLLMTLVIGWMLGLLSEGLLGRTPGKVLAGCWVAIVGSDGQGKGLSAPNDAQGPRAPGEREGASGTSDHGIGLGRAAVRNTLKWLIPFGLATALGPGGRHLGDVAAGTIVVERRSGDTEKG